MKHGALYVPFPALTGRLPSSFTAPYSICVKPWKGLFDSGSTSCELAFRNSTFFNQLRNML